MPKAVELYVDMAQVLTNLKGGRLHAISMRRTADETRDAGLTLERADRVNVSTNSWVAASPCRSIGDFRSPSRDEADT